MRALLIAALIVATMAGTKACAPEPHGQSKSPAPGVPGAPAPVDPIEPAHVIEIKCTMYDHNGKSVNVGVIAEGDFTIMRGKIETDWPKGRQPVTLPLTALLRMHAGSAGANVWVHCMSGGILPNYKLECTLRVDGILFDRQIDLGGPRGKVELGNVTCRYFGP